MESYLQRLAALHAELGIPADYAATRGLTPCLEANTLVPLGIDALERDQFADAEAAAAWAQMRDTAQADGVGLQFVSVFRSVDYQASIIRRKLSKGQSMSAILAVSAAPGYSEHHTGRAFDITAAGVPPLETVFEETTTYTWLTQHAAEFGFYLSYPRDNPQGFIYEPWHWLYQPTAS
jgi:D-alanyl-D-alanine carboxypeptidase